MLKGPKEELNKLRNELAQAEQRIELLEHELGKLNRITELVKDLVIITDDEGKIRHASQALYPTLGYTLQDITGKHLSSLVHSDDKLAFEVFFKRLNSEKTLSVLHRIRKKSRKYLWIETSCRKKNISKSDMVFYLRDLSDKMKLQTDLLVSHQRYKSLVENLPFVLFRYDKKLKPIFVSPNVSDLLPFEPGEISGSRFSELGFDKDRVDFFEEAIHEVFDTGRIVEREYEQETQKGLLSLAWKLIPEYDDNNRINTILGILEDITEIKNIQKKQKSSEEKFRHIFNTIPDAVVLSRMEDGLLLDVNEGFLNLTGYTRKEVIDRSSVEIKLFRDQKTRDDFRNELRNGPIINKEMVFYDKDRNEVVVLISSSPISLYGDQLLISIFRDISGIKENEQRLSETIFQLQQTEEKFDSFIEQSPDGIVLTDEEGVISNWNKSMEEFTGLERGKVIGTPWDTVIHEIIRNDWSNKDFTVQKDLINKFMGEVPSPSRNLKFEADFHLEGREIIHLANILFRIDVKGKNRYGLISRDTTQEKKNRDQALLYKDIFQKNEDGIAILNTDGTYREINNTYRNIIGYGIEDLRDKDSSVIIGKKIYSEVFKVFDFQGIFDGELKATTHKGKKIYLDFLLFPVKTEDETICIVQIIRDITDRKVGEQKLIEAKRRAENADKLKTAFLSNMSHEIRTPMNSILGFATLLENPKLTRKQRSKYIEYINRNGENLLNLIGDIIDIAKIESNKLRINKSPCNLNYLMSELKESLEKVKELEGRKNVQLRVSYDKNTSITIDTDCYRLRQVLVNLIFNAIKFTHEGFIEFGFIERKKELIFHVKDTGIGIPEEMKDKIFERFHKNESSAKKSYAGAGLGLAISSQLVRLLGGKIWVESEVGKGTSFYFSHPYLTSNKQKIIDSSDTKISSELNWESRKLLIAEDDPYSSDLMTEFLADTKVTILYAENGEKAVEVFTENADIDLVVMDIRLPKISGIEAARMIRENNPEIPIIAQSAFAMEEDKLLIKTAGFDEFLVKPLDKKEFLKVLSRFFDKDTNP